MSNQASTTQSIQLDFMATEREAGKRLDAVLAAQYPEYSRSLIQNWIKTGEVTVDKEKIKKPRFALHPKQHICVRAQLTEVVSAVPQAIPLDIVYEDESILVINKPAGLVVHPGAGVRQGTLLNALLHHQPQLALLPRAGIVHRLDKDTTGLMVIAKTLNAHARLIEAMQAREICRDYEAVVYGYLVAGGTVNAPIDRHPVHRTRMAVVKQGGRAAVSHYRVLERFGPVTRLLVSLETGRTHQIRVHMAHIKHPIVGDPVYCARARMLPAFAAANPIIQHFNRQALHATRLALVHPESGEGLEWQVDSHQDMIDLIEALRKDAQGEDNHHS